jgi:hypothetical protein
LRWALCDPDHCSVVARHRERLLVSKQATQKFDMQRFYLKKLNDSKVKNSIRSKSQTGMQLWKTWMINMDINTKWENIRI